MPNLALLPPGRSAAARLNEALRTEHSLVEVESWASLVRTLSSETLEGAVLDPHDAQGALRLSDLRRLRRRFPGTALILFADFQGREIDLFHLGRLEMDGILEDRGFGATRELRTRTEEALDAALATRVSIAVGRRLRPLAIRCLAAAVQQARRTRRSSELATALGLSGKVLQATLRAGGLPTARRFLLWGRLIEGAYLLDRPTITVEDSAFRVRYSTAAAMHSAFQRTIGVSPRKVMAQGGWRYVLDAAVLELRGSKPSIDPIGSVM